MGFFSKIFKGIKKVVKGIGKVVKKVVKSKAFKVIAAVALAVVAPQLIPTIMKGISTAGAWAANTIATGASAVWTGVKAAGSAVMSGAKAAGSAIKSFGSKVFQSVTETITNGVDFMKSKLGFKPTSNIVPKTGFNPADFQVGAGGNEIFAPTVKKTLGEKIVSGGKTLLGDIGEGLKKQAGEQVKETALDVILGQRKEADLVGTKSYAKSIGGYDSSQGYAPLMNLATNTQSPYLSYSQGQQLFGGLKPATGMAQ